MSDQRRRDAYERVFIEWSDRIEKLLVRAIGAVLALLLIAQLLLLSPWIRERVTRVDRLEGVPYRHAGESGGTAATIAPSAAKRN